MINKPQTRKVAYDPHSRCFYFETKIETLARQCMERAKKTEALNRTKNHQLDTYRKIIEQEEHLLNQKRGRQMFEVRTSLREQVAYRRVLDRIKDRNGRNNKHPANYGLYGQGSSHTELMPVIEDELRLMNPQEKRNKEVRRLLHQRKLPEVLDRTLPDDVILGKRHYRRQHVRRTTSEDRKRPKLVLPPLIVSIATVLTKDEGSISSHSDGKGRTDDVTLPLIFMTQ